VTPVELLLSAVSALSLAVSFLYLREARRTDRLEKDLENERKSRVELYEKNLEFYMSVQEKQNEQNAHNASIAEALLRGEARRRQ
jgi:hypothetical protein